jgi:hypothetical protein
VPDEVAGVGTVLLKAVGYVDSVSGERGKIRDQGEEGRTFRPPR